MEHLEISAKTAEEAIQIALKQLGVSREEVKVTVLREGRTGLLGLGAEEALVRVEPLLPVSEQESDASETVRSVLETLLNMMEISGSIVSKDSPVVGGEEEVTAPIAFDITGDDLGILIGRRGQTLASLQYIVRLIVGNKTKTWAPIVIDVEGYKQRRDEVLRNLAERMAEQVRARGTSFTLEPMPAYERRIIHITLADHPDVTTESIGEGFSRKVVILPKED